MADPAAASPVQRFGTAAALHDAAADAVIAQARAAIDARGKFHFALAGGNTPWPLYERLATSPRRERIHWPSVHIWFGDERCVPPDSDRSNYHMVEQALLRHIGIPAGNVHRMRGEMPPEAAAAAYAGALRQTFGDSGPPCLDLILLGIGGDGHTASLFPGTPALLERERWVCGQFVEAQREWRLTLTYPVLNAAAALWVLAVGADKANVVARVLQGPRLPSELPIQAVTPSDGELRWWLDTAAATALR